MTGIGKRKLKKRENRKVFVKEKGKERKKEGEKGKKKNDSDN